MRDTEKAYWDEVADKRTGGGRMKYISDNSFKRAAIVSRILRHEWYKRSILEIGVGFASVVGVLRIVYLDNFTYFGTDVSPIFCEKAKDFFDVDVLNTDILALPNIEGGFHRVIALDSLEHVRPEDRDEGYLGIKRALAPDATMFINMPFEETQHNLEFDHLFTTSDIDRICTLTGLRLVSFEEYQVKIETNRTVRRYGWAVLKRGNGG